MAIRSVIHSTFTLERSVDIAPARLFQAFADPAAKARWFVGPHDWTRGPHMLDFRVGGRERTSGGAPGGPVHTFDSIYHEIVPNERIVYSYDVHVDATRISVALVTIEFHTARGGTRLVVTEQTAFLDEHDTPAQREQGWHSLLDALEASVSESASAST